MKRLLITVFTFMFLAACGTTDEKPGNIDQDLNGNPGSNQPDSENTSDPSTNEEGTDDQSYMKSEMDELDFYDIQIEVSYDNDKEYEAEIDQDNDEPIKAEVDDELNGVKLVGREAFDNIYEKVKNLSVTTDSSQQEIIDQVLEVFDLPEDYQKIEIEIKFNDGSEIDFESRA